MDRVQPSSVALVVTSPPYFAGKQYEEELGREGIPASYRRVPRLLLERVRRVRRQARAGGRIAVNVANLGRKPYRSLSADVIGILQDRLGLLLRGEVVWRKARGAGGNCAWGSFRSPANPVLRDLTERVVVASKGRSTGPSTVHSGPRRACPTRRRPRPTSSWRPRSTCGSWRPRAPPGWGIPRRSRSSCPSGFVELYTYRGDVVLDPFMGVGHHRGGRRPHGAALPGLRHRTTTTWRLPASGSPPSRSSWPKRVAPAGPGADKAVEAAGRPAACRGVRRRRRGPAQVRRGGRGAGGGRSRRPRVAGRGGRRVHRRPARASAGPTSWSARWGAPHACPASCPPAAGPGHHMPAPVGRCPPAAGSGRGRLYVDGAPDRAGGTHGRPPPRLRLGRRERRSHGDLDGRMSRHAPIAPERLGGSAGDDLGRAGESTCHRSPGNASPAAPVSPTW
jgi:hypothetical protein